MGVRQEKMREMQEALKSAGRRLRRYTRFPHQPAAVLRQKAEELKERARRWRSRTEELPPPEKAKAAPTLWERLWPRSAAEDTAIPEVRPLPEQVPPPEKTKTTPPLWERLWPRNAADDTSDPEAHPLHQQAPTPERADATPPLWERLWPRSAAENTAASASRPSPQQVPPHAEMEAVPPLRERRWLRVAAEDAVISEAPPSPRPQADASWEGRRPAWLEAARMAIITLLVLLALPYGLLLVYRVIDPPFSALMARQWLTGVSIHQQWVDFEDISPALAQAVVVSEDSAFCRHLGVDWSAVNEAIEDAEDGVRVRGASTIPMQTAKNLFLWNGQSYLRKALEVPLAYAMTALWPKRRVLEVYLNIAEWGPGIFGAEAAARYHFRKSAALLTPREAALLAASLPNPITRSAGRPNGLTARIAAHVGARVGREAHDAACVFRRGR